MNIYPASREAANAIVRAQEDRAIKFAIRKVNGISYAFTFTNQGKYVITRPDGKPVYGQKLELEFCTRQIGTAKQWLKEFLEN